MSLTMARMEEILESFNSHDVDRIVANFDESGEFLMAAGPEPYGERFVGREAIGEVLRQRFSAVPDIRWVDAKTWISGDRAACSGHDREWSSGLSRLRPLGISKW